ncbi:hypothetical protein BKA62DRAFT_721814 [Auriculariales sp. MPI-PUGE-AT-0066]|nr:hypothetical protein BKA62DRAFT_721814 [Auriculariales sp. MPI-PUGE-AT-0066]
MQSSYRMKLAIFSVCKAWKALSEQLLYSAVLVSSLPGLDSLVKALALPAERPVPIIEDSGEIVWMRGHWTRRLDFRLSKHGRACLIKEELMVRGSGDDEVFRALVKAQVTTLTSLCPRLEILINHLIPLSGPGEWLHVVVNHAVLSSLQPGRLRVLHFNDYHPGFSYETANRAVDFAALFRDLRVISGPGWWSIIPDDFDINLDCPHLQSFAIDCFASRVQVSTQSVYQLTLGQTAFPLSNDAQHFVQRHAGEVTELRISNSSNINHPSPLRQMAPFMTNLRSLETIPTLQRLGITARRGQASRNEYKAFFSRVGLARHNWSRFSVLRILSQRLVLDLQGKHGRFLDGWLKPFLNSDVRVENSQGALIHEQVYEGQRNEDKARVLEDSTTAQTKLASMLDVQNPCDMRRDG